MTAVPGLAIIREPVARESWAVVHAPSGACVIEDLAGLATAEIVAEALEDLEDVDWTLAPPEIADAADLLLYVGPTVERIAARHGGSVPGRAVYSP